MQDIKYLFEKFLNGSCTREEIALLMEHFNLHGNAKALDDLIEPAMLEVKEPSGDDPQIAALLRRNRKLIMQAIDKPVRKIPLYTKIVAAACMLVLAAAVTYLLYRDMAGPRTIDKTTHVSDIMPGTNKATLTLSDGRVISLSAARNAKVASDGNADISQTEEGRLIYESAGKRAQATPLYNAVNTPKGGQYQIVLPDGTKVWLNAASSLTYSPDMITDGKRMVHLTGEAYFEVAKDPAHPFVVSSPGQVVKVLGTHFNINSYADEPATVTTLTEGSVQVQTDEAIIKIKPGQQSLLSTDRLLNVKSADVGLALAWKNGDLAFEEAGIKEVLRQLSRWYDFDVVYSGPVPDDTITGTVSRKSSLSAVLKMFSTMNVHFKIEQEHERKKLVVYK